MKTKFCFNKLSNEFLNQLITFLPCSVMQNVDDLFERPELSAASDVGWPDCFNSGVFVFEPSSKTFSELLDMAVTKGSFDGADQGLLNQYFSSWATDDARYD